MEMSAMRGCSEEAAAGGILARNSASVYAVEPHKPAGDRGAS